MSGLQVRAQLAIWANGIEFLVKNPITNEICKEIVMESTADFYLAPSFTLGRQEAQVLMDDLWQAGLRPSEGTGSAGALKATQDHLKDMRTIAMNLLEIE